MLDNLKEFKALAADNQISQEDYLSAAAEVEKLKENYERIAYIMFLLNQPNRKSKKPDSMSMKWYKALKYASKEAIIDENRDALCKIKDLLAISKKSEKKHEDN